MRDATDVVTVMTTTITMTTMTKSTSVVDVAVKRKMMITTTMIDPVDVEGMMTMKTWISPAPRTVMTGTIVTMTSLKCVVVEEDGECDGTGSLLFQQ